MSFLAKPNNSPLRISPEKVGITSIQYIRMDGEDNKINIPQNQVNADIKKEYIQFIKK